MKRASALKRVLEQFFKTTTLHGFKYLWSNFCIDRCIWSVGCCASACCAGVLCAVLWARFLELPALLELRGPARAAPAHMPTLLVCPHTHTLALALIANMNLSSVDATQLSSSIASVLSTGNTSKSQTETLDKLFFNDKITLTDALLKYSSSCEDLIVRCRWQNLMMPCAPLFKKELSTDGVCCVMRPQVAYKAVEESLRPTGIFSQTRTMDLALQCSNESVYNCKFTAKFEDETNVQAMALAPGYIYTAQMIYNSVPMDSTEDLIASNCNSDKSYSKENCQDKCAENFCKCSDPLKSVIGFGQESNYPKCDVKQFRCLRAYDERENEDCVCLPSCNKITADINLESSRMDLSIFTMDPIYNGLHSKSTVLHFQLNLHSSKIFSLNPTETWITLLSSLGGVFNMFLGVGLFSALEIVYLVLVRLPAVIFKSQFV